MKFQNDQPPEPDKMRQARADQAIGKLLQDYAIWLYESQPENDDIFGNDMPPEPASYHERYLQEMHRRGIIKPPK